MVVHRIVLVPVLAVAAAAAATAGAGARSAPSRTCPDVVGPEWTYKTGTATNAPVYSGTHYTLSVRRISCSAAAPLVRRVVVITWRGNGLKLLKGYGCGAGVLAGAKLVAGQCVSSNAASPTRNPKSFSWTPDILDPTSKRLS